MSAPVPLTGLEKLLADLGMPDAVIAHDDGQILWYRELRGNRQSFALILGMESELRRLADLIYPRATERGLLEIYSMGDERMLLNGRPVILRMRKAIEIITYLLEQGSITLDKLLTDVFPETRRRTSRSYFHQVKQEVKLRLPELKIVFDAKARRYRIETDLRLRWDVAELREGRAMGSLGLFLPTSGSEWALELNQELEELKEELGLVGSSKRRHQARWNLEEVPEASLA